ncbi:MAG: hypothetical protein ACXWDO_04270 [Bacteroidia bacterium]
MKRYFRGFIILISLVVVSGKIKAQNDSSYYRYIIKTNVFQWGMNEANIAFEYRFSKKFGLESTFGKNGIMNSIYESSYIPYQGFALRLNPKLYYSDNSDPRKGCSYISTLILFKRNKLFKPSRELFGYDRIQRQTIAGFSLILGRQVAVGKHFLFDFYSGLGIRYRFEKTYYNAPKLNPNINLGIKLGYGFKPIN